MAFDINARYLKADCNGQVALGDSYVDCAKLNIASSPDGVHWTRSNSVTYTPPAGAGVGHGLGVLIPRLWRDRGKWICAIPDVWGDAADFNNAAWHYFTIAQSVDGLNWDALPKYHIDIQSLGIASGKITWNSNFITTSDGVLHNMIVVATANSSDKQVYETHPVVPGDYSAWSTAVLCPVTGESNCENSFVIERGGTFYLFTNSSPGSYLILAQCATLVGTYTPMHSGADFLALGHTAEEFAVYTDLNGDDRFLFGFHDPDYAPSQSDITGDWTNPLVTPTASAPASYNLDDNDDELQPWGEASPPFDRVINGPQTTLISRCSGVTFL